MIFIQLSFFDKDYMKIIKKVKKVKNVMVSSFKKLTTKIDSVVKKSRGWEYKEIKFVAIDYNLQV